MATMFGVDYTVANGVVRVRDGHDTWLCTLEAWDTVTDVVDSRGGDYDDICRKIASPIASINGTSRGDVDGLVRMAYAGELIDDDDARAYGVVI